MGSPETLERFLCTALAAYPARQYYFYMFAHGQGVLDTRTYGPVQRVKTLSMSRDDTSGHDMTLDRFHQALKKALNGRRFELMVFFSCLANMVEVDYAMSDVTRYLVASQDEIRLVNDPPGRYQLRGMRFEELIAGLKRLPQADSRELGRILVDSHVDGYERNVRVPSGDGHYRSCRFSGGMALVDAAATPQLVSALDALARQLIVQSRTTGVAQAMLLALSSAQPFASFLNLEYYDLFGYIRHLRNAVRQPGLKNACDRVLHLLTDCVLVYVRHTPDSAAAGISIYLSHPLVPENIFRAHQVLYQANRFSRDTKWDEMIEIFRARLTSISTTDFHPPAATKKGRAVFNGTRP